jgi:hypothetical protein
MFRSLFPAHAARIRVKISVSVANPDADRIQKFKNSRRKKLNFCLDLHEVGTEPQHCLCELWNKHPRKRKIARFTYGTYRTDTVPHPVPRTFVGTGTMLAKPVKKKTMESNSWQDLFLASKFMF